jgi:hypothetical protein
VSERARSARARGGLAGLGGRRTAGHALGRPRLRRRQIARVVAQRLHRALERRAAQHLGALLELLAERTLPLGELLQRLAHLSRSTRRVGGTLHVGELTGELRGERLAEHALHVGELPCERRVDRPRLAQAALDGGRLLAHGRDAVL